MSDAEFLFSDFVVLGVALGLIAVVVLFGYLSSVLHRRSYNRETGPQ